MDLKKILEDKELQLNEVDSSVVTFKGAIRAHGVDDSFRLYPEPRINTRFLVIKNEDVLGEVETFEESKEEGLLTKLFSVPVRKGAEVMLVTEETFSAGKHDFTSVKAPRRDDLTKQRLHQAFGAANENIWGPQSQELAGSCGWGCCMHHPGKKESLTAGGSCGWGCCMHHPGKKDSLTAGGSCGWGCCMHHPGKKESATAGGSCGWGCCMHHPGGSQQIARGQCSR